MSNSRYSANTIMQQVGDEWNTINPAKAPDYMTETTQYTIPSDTNVPGFAPGMDDLAQIILNNKYKAVLNRNTMTMDGARDWVSKKNRTIKNKDKHWKTAYNDVNGDEIPEILIKDGQGNIRYINGWHLAKAQNNVDQLFQKEIEEQYGLPADRSVKRATGGIPERALSYPYFLYRHLNKDPQYPDGPLIPDEALKSAGYTARAPSPANLLLSHCTKHLYKEIVEDPEYIPNKNNQKMVKKIFSVIQANAVVYREMVTNVVIARLNDEKRSEKDAKKKQSGQAYSYYTQLCLQKVMSICKNENNAHEQIKSLIRSRVNYVLENNTYNPADPLVDKYDNSILWNRKVRPDAGPEGEVTVPRINLSNVAINQAKLDRGRAFSKFMGYSKNKPQQASQPVQQQTPLQQQVVAQSTPPTFNAYDKVIPYDIREIKNYPRMPNGAINVALSYNVPLFGSELRSNPNILPSNITVSNKNHVYLEEDGKKSSYKMAELFTYLANNNMIHPQSVLVDAKGNVIARRTAP